MWQCLEALLLSQLESRDIWSVEPAVLVKKHMTASRTTTMKSHLAPKGDSEEAGSLATEGGAVAAMGCRGSGELPTAEQAQGGVRGQRKRA